MGNFRCGTAAWEEDCSPARGLNRRSGGGGEWVSGHAADAMPFLHGFRRIIFEYQPLVDAILGALGIQDLERQEPLDE